MFFRRVYLELSEHGELMVRALSAGRAQAACLWSSWSGSCSPTQRHLHRVGETLRGSVKPIIRNWFSLHRAFHKEFIPSIHAFYKKLLSGEFTKAIMDKFSRLLKSLLASEQFRRLSAYFKVFSNNLLRSVRHLWKWLAVEPWLRSSLCGLDGFGKKLLKNPPGSGEWGEWLKAAISEGERAKRACLDQIDVEKEVDGRDVGSGYNYYDDLPKKVRRKKKRVKTA